MWRLADRLPLVEPGEVKVPGMVHQHLLILEMQFPMSVTPGINSGCWGVAMGSWVSVTAYKWSWGPENGCVTGGKTHFLQKAEPA